MDRKNNKLDFLKEYSIESHKIMAMEEEKRNRLIQVALEEFLKDYDVANTDTITKNAGISKGLLFHYFGSKKDLFLFLTKYALDIVADEYIKISFDSCDFLENLWKVSLLAIDLSYRYPIIYGFLAKVPFSMNKVFPDGLPQGIHDPTEELMLKIYLNSDESLFRDDIDIEMARNIIVWTIKGFSDKLLDYGSDIDNYKANYETIKRELNNYLKILRKLFYR